MLQWLNGREAAGVGAALADALAARAATARESTAAAAEAAEALRELLRRADREVRALRLNFYKKAKLANTFKWRLIENGIDRKIADELTQAVVLYVSQSPSAAVIDDDPAATAMDRPHPTSARAVFIQGNECIARGAYTEAIAFYEKLLNLNPRHAEGLNNLGAAFCKVARYKEAEKSFRQAILASPDYADPHSNIGNMLRWTGRVAESESWLRRAVRLNPKHLDARNNLGLTLILLRRLRDAKAQFQKVLKVSPRNADALFGMGRTAALEGSFEEAGTMYNRALAANPKMPSAWAGMAGIRRMTAADADWLKGAEQIAASGLAPLDEAEMHFAIGKYYDDLNDFAPAFKNYKRANELLKAIAESYDRAERTRFVDDLIRVFTKGAISTAAVGGSDSVKPVFVVGMPRSGTSLVEQIIASHPAAAGAGELEFWSDAADANESDLRRGILSETTRKKLAEGYLRFLEAQFGDASRIVDKSTINSDYLGLIGSVFPNPRIIHMRRDPIDTCLSCYFHQFPATLNFTMDLSDLAHYYREHQRLMTHWRGVLPPGSILDVPYGELVADQAGWTRKILDFLGLEWDERCLDFHKTKRGVVTSSFWQVRQKMYKSSVERWRNYEKFVGPLKGLSE